MQYVRVPFSNEAEQSVLGGLMMDKSKYDQVAGIVSELDFYHEGHRTIFAAITRLHLAKIPFDPVTLSEELEKAGKLDSIGGLAYLGGMARNTPSAANVKHYADIVKKKAKYRKLIDIAEVLATGAYEETEGVEVDVIRDLMALETVDKRYTHTLRETLAVVLDNLEEGIKNNTRVPGIPTGLTELDHRLGGMRKGHLHIIGARPRMGKTAMIMNIMDKCGAVAGFISAEQGHDQIGMRAMSISGRVDTQKISVPALINDEDWAKITNAVGNLSQRDIYIFDKAAPSIDEVEREARRMKQEHGIEILLVDYIQRLRANANSKREEVGIIAMRLKEIARELDIPVVAGAQVVRSIEQRADKRPMISDLKEAGALEEEADVIYLLYRDEVYNSNTEDKNTAEIDIGKNRHGPDGMVKVIWQGQYLRFEDYANETY